MLIEFYTLLLGLAALAAFRVGNGGRDEAIEEAFAQGWKAGYRTGFGTGQQFEDERVNGNVRSWNA